MIQNKGVPLIFSIVGEIYIANPLLKHVIRRLASPDRELRNFLKIGVKEGNFAQWSGHLQEWLMENLQRETDMKITYIHKWAMKFHKMLVAKEIARMHAYTSKYDSWNFVVLSFTVVFLLIFWLYIFAKR